MSDASGLNCQGLHFSKHWGCCTRSLQKRWSPANSEACLSSEACRWFLMMRHMSAWLRRDQFLFVRQSRICDHGVVLVRDDASACWPAKSILFIRPVNGLQNREVGEVQDKLLRRFAFWNVELKLDPKKESALDTHDGSAFRHRPNKIQRWVHPISVRRARGIAW